MHPLPVPVKRERGAADPDAGEATVLGIGLVFVVLVVLGLVWDGTQVLVARSRMQSVADSAALAGASAVSQRWIQTADPSTPPELDPVLARGVVLRSLEISRRQLLPAEFHVDLVDAGPGAVGVAVHTRIVPSFLGLAGVGALDVAAAATAEPRQLPRPPDGPR